MPNECASRKLSTKGNQTIQATHSSTVCPQARKSHKKTAKIPRSPSNSPASSRGSVFASQAPNMPPSKQDNYDLEIQQPLKEHDSMDNSQQKPLMTENSKQHIASPSNMKSITACSLYSFCSVSMVLVNKSLASRWVRNDGVLLQTNLHTLISHPISFQLRKFVRRKLK